jgi:hypothetical protein
MKNPLHRRTGAFALVEFLCVVAVIGLLALAALMLLPRKPVLIPAKTNSSPTNFSAAKIPAQPSPATASSRESTNKNKRISQAAAQTRKPAALDPRLSPFDNFSHWLKLFTNSSASLADGERLAWKRREAMLELIQTDPKRAIEMSVPFALRQSLPPQVTRFFEQQLDGRGDFQVAVATDFATGQTAAYRHVQLAGKTYQAFVYDRRVAQPCQTGIPLHGVSLDGKMAVAAEPLRVVTADEAAALARARGHALDKICSVSGLSADVRHQPVYAESGGGVLCFCGTDHYDLVNRQWALAESGAGGVGGSGIAGVGAPVNDPWTHGVKTVLYMRVNFPDDLTEPVSEAAAYSAMNSVNLFYTTTSYNLTALDATVTPLVTLPQTKAYYSADPTLLLADARAAVKLAGFDTANYDRDIVAFTSVPNYSFGGLAYVGGKGVWLQSFSAGVAAHELGHNYGLWHANSWDTPTASAIGPGTNLEYGNFYDTMGAANAGIYQFNAVHKNKLDWLKADAVQVVATNGVYRLYPFDVPASARVDGRFYAAAVQKDFARYYWLEFRKLFTGNPWTQNGVLLNWSPWDESNGGTQLIDTTPGSPTFSGDSRDDAAVVVGRTFNDNAAGVHITPIARGATGTEPWLDVQVNTGPFPSNQPPVLGVEMDQASVAPGTLVHFHATASDPDGDMLAYAWAFDDLTFSTNNQPWISKTFFTNGDHVVRCVVSDMKGGEASANVVVTVGSPGGFRVSGQVTDTNGAPLEGVLVSNGATDAADFVGGWTDSSGRYVIVNVTSNLNLNAVQFGCTFASATNWSNPLAVTNDFADADFLGTPLTTVNIAADTNAVVESDGSAHFFTVTRTGDTNSDLTVPLFISGTATLGTDYTLSPPVAGSAVTIPAGTNSVTFTFKAVNDSLVEGPETATLTLLDDLNYISPGYALAPMASATITILDDDSPAQPTVTVATSTPEISEDGIDSGEFVFTRNGAAQGDLLVNYFVGGSAQAGTDYAPLAGVVLIPAGQNSATVYLQPLDDHAVESNATVVVTIAASAAYILGNAVSATVTILDDGASVVTVFPTAEPAAEPSTAGTFTVKRDGDLTEALVIGYTVGGTAVPGVDYVPLSGTATIPAGATSTGVTLVPIDDGVLTPDKFVTLILTNDYNYDVGTPGSASISITESERPTVSITAPVNSVSEQGDTFGEFTISRTTTSGDLSVYLALSGTATPGADYLPLDNPVVIPNGSGSVTLDVIPFHDLILEPTEDVVLTVQSNLNYNVGSPNTARVSILDDGTTQTPGVGFCFAASAFPEGQSPGIAVALTVTSSVPVTVDYKVIGGTAPANRYSLPQGTLVFNPGDLVDFIPLQIVNDTIVEPPQTVKVVIFNPINATLDYIKVHTYTILDDDSASVSVTATAPNASETGPVAGNFRLTRAGATNASQLVNFQITGTASAPTDYAPLGTSATIPAGATFVDLPVIPTDDHTPELSQTVVLTLISATNGAIVSPNVATVTIGDNDTNPLPVVAVTSTNQPYAIEGGTNGAFLFTRIGATNNALNISFTISGTAVAGVRYVALTNSVIIPAGQISVTLPVVAIDDHVVEGEQTVIVSLTENETYRSAYPSSATVTIQDNDQRVWIDASDFDASKYGLDPGQFTFSRFGTTNTPVTIFYAISGTASNGLDYVFITNAIVIPAGSLTATLPVLPLHTGVPRGPVTVTLTLLTNAAFFAGAPTNATVVIDDDMPMVTISGVVTNVLEGGATNGVFRLTRTGDPQYDFTAYLAVGGTAVFNVSYAAFATNVYFSCGVTAIDLYVSTFNDGLADGDHTVAAALIPNPAYTILSPSNALINITDAGADQTPQVRITKPLEKLVFLAQTNRGLYLTATVVTAASNTLAWTEQNGLTTLVFDSTNTANTGVLFSNAGVYRLRLTADDGQLQGYDEITVVVGGAQLIPASALHWPFDEGGGTNVHDASGFGHDGIFAGSPAWTNGVLGGALNFSGANDFIRQASGGNVLNGQKAFTLSLWVYSTATNLDRGFFTASLGAGATLSLATRSRASCGNFTNVIEATLATTKGVMHRISASNAAQANQWQNLVFTWTNGLAPELYINGRLDQPASQWAALAGALTNCPDFVIGKGAADSPGAWRGIVDDVQLFSGVLDTNQIVAIAGNCADCTVGNAAPLVDAGQNQAVQIGLPFLLSGAAGDDGLPNPPGVLTNSWEQLYTNTVNIPNTNSVTNVVVFADPGDYTFRFAADDGDIATFANVTITAILPTEVDVYADVPDAYELGPVPGDFTLTRNGDTNDLTVYLAISGTASNGVDYVTLTNAVTFTGGSNSIALPLTPVLDYAIEGDESVIVSIVTNIAYFIGNGQATATIHDSPYGLWSIAHFTLEQLTHPNISGPGADFDHDGIVNFAEYAFNLDPTVSNTPPPYAWDFETDTNDNRLHLTLTYTRRLPPRDVEYGVFVSTNLLTWNTGTNYVEEFSRTDDGNNLTETVKTRALMPFPSRTNLFINIRVWLQQVPGP